MVKETNWKFRIKQRNKIKVFIWSVRKIIHPVKMQEIVKEIKMCRIDIAVTKEMKWKR